MCSGNFVRYRSSVDENRPFSQGKHCSVCNEPTKGHLGPYGPGRCIRGIVIKLTERVDELEKAGKIKDKQLRELERLSAERQEALLATIQVLDEQIKHMEKRQESSSKFCESTDCDEPLDFSGSSMTYRPPLMGKEQANSTITVQSSESKNEVQCASVYLKGCLLSSAMDAKSEEEGQKDDMLQQRTVPAPPETENFVACTHALQDATIRQYVSGRSTSESQSKIAALVRGIRQSLVALTPGPSKEKLTQTIFVRKVQTLKKAGNACTAGESGLENSTSLRLPRGCTVWIVLQPKRSICQALVSTAVLVMSYSIAEIEEW